MVLCVRVDFYHILDKKQAPKSSVVCLNSQLRERNLNLGPTAPLPVLLLLNLAVWPSGPQLHLLYREQVELGLYFPGHQELSHL